ncbi:MAG: type III-B CRISPR-associated protein Cas10/Cmr2 [Candidatus Jettenia sp. CY-1]|nr:MAG: type III-B CRISPR-associated protein Cas10/Cmr2 [Candidatus Jettenia sp. CY-1]
MRYLTIIQHGPVQDFIHTARRTDDYWAGSFLLSYITTHIIKKLKDMGGEIVSPGHDNDPLAMAVLKDAPIKDEALQPSLPNRVIAIVDSQDADTLKKSLNKIKNTVLDEIVKLFEKAETTTTGNPAAVSQEQVKDMFEFYFSFTEYNNSCYGDLLKEAENALAMRKNIRSFNHFIAKGHKCTQCGIREPLRENVSTNTDNSSRPALINYWKKLRTGNHKYTFKDNERLCAVCAGKRLLREQFNSGGIPSTSTIAISTWLSKIVNTLKDDKINNFIYKLDKKIIPSNGTRVQGNSNKNNILFDIEGSCFISDSYSRFEKDCNDDQKSAVREAKKALEEMLEGHSKPPKYYTILSIDGDSMGKKIRSLNDREKHKEVSKKLSEFTKYVYETIKSKYHGYVVYYGGDEGMILLPLSETMDCMNEIRKEFTRQITSFTLSAGAAIVHHQSPLGRGLKAANEALRMAKKIEGKNAFSFNIHIRSGSQIFCASPWEINGLDVINYLKEWNTLYKSDALSPRWYYQFKVIEPTFQDERGLYNVELAMNELYHILLRHTADNKKNDVFALLEKTKVIHYYPGIGFENFASMLYTPLFIYRKEEE